MIYLHRLESLDCMIMNSTLLYRWLARSGQPMPSQGIEAIWIIGFWILDSSVWFLDSRFYNLDHNVLVF